MASFFVSIVTLIQLGIVGAQLMGNINVDELQEVSHALSQGSLSLENFRAVSSILYVAVLGIFAIFQVGLALSIIRGRQRARKILLAILSAGFIFTAIDTITGSVLGGNLYAVFVLMSSHVFALIEYTSDGAVNYTHNSTQIRQKARRKAS